MSNFIILGPFGQNTATQNAVFGDVYEGNVPNAHYIHSYAGNIVSKVLHWMLVCTKFGKKLPQKLRQFWTVRYCHIKRHISPDTDNYIVFVPSTHPFERIPPRLIKKLRKHQPNTRLIYYFIDGVERTAQISKLSLEKLLDFMKQFDGVYTYDRNDSERFGYAFIEIPLWISTEPAVGSNDCDLYFCGRDKGRSELLMALFDRANAEGVKCHYRIADLRPENVRDGIVSAAWTPYSETIREARKANCILELLAENNHGATLRYKEAVIYNKKLLTNNPEISHLPYYDARWMRYLDKAEDVDFEWLRREEDVSYGYRGDFSAAHFLSEIERMYHAEHH